jgi:hypothetical protein
MGTATVAVEARDGRGGEGLMAQRAWRRDGASLSVLPLSYQIKPFSVLAGELFDYVGDDRGAVTYGQALRCVTHGVVAAPVWVEDAGNLQS